MNGIPSSILLLGATSSLARELSFRFAENGATLHLVARNADRLNRLAQDISVRYSVPVSWSTFDAEKDDAADVFSEASRWLGSCNGVVACQGSMPEAGPKKQENSELERLLRVNFSSIAIVLLDAARAFELSGKGFIGVVSSVAGDRGRRNNYGYGSAKAGLNAYLEGLRSRLTPPGIQVLTIKAGFMDTHMTYGKSGIFLAANPAAVASKIIRAIEKNKSVIYVPWFWRWIMLVIRLIPEFVFKRLSI